MEEEFKALDPKLEVKRIPILGKEIRDKKGFSPVLDWGYYDDDDVKYNGKVNIVAIHTPNKHTGRSLILNGHVDVVPVCAEEMWSSPPFTPVVRDGKLYGRGAGDMKAGVVAYCMAYKALLSLNYAPAAPVYLQSVIEEECTGNGTLHISQQYKADAVIIPEPLDETVSTAFMGVLWVRVIVYGKPVHVLQKQDGTNSIIAVQTIYTALQELEKNYNELAKKHPSYKDTTHPVNLNLGVIKGGDWASSVPAKCEFQIRVGFLPGQNIDDVKNDVEKIVARVSKQSGIETKIEYHGFHAEGCVVDCDSPMFKCLGDAIHDVTKEEAKHWPATCTTDARVFQLYHHTPATCYGPKAKNIHGIDECVDLESMKRVTQVLAVFIARWCGLEKS
eukprot:TRINITY_DN8339_c0_g1_i1.p1 TRINITY_DN8339_c0_g1~~TRINITY_DN8339_c0_g1_i1.p1  ORF type:complete len:443 (-),score=98.64 TRINITY_DN8339_c0_g1_i1:56-1222(-)